MLFDVFVQRIITHLNSCLLFIFILLIVFHARRTEAVKLLQAGKFFHEKCPHIGFANEDEEHENCRKNVEDIGWNPEIGRSTNRKRNHLSHP